MSLPAHQTVKLSEEQPAAAAGCSRPVEGLTFLDPKGVCFAAQRFG
jgi:hypothetical protein